MKKGRDPKPTDSFLDCLGYRFKNTELLQEALTHPSYANESGLSFHNQRLEFLGDAVLELIVSELLFQQERACDEGALTKLRSQIVRKESLARWAQQIKLTDSVLLGKSLKKAGVTESIAADAAEALFGAVFVDGGYESAKEVVIHFFRFMSREISLDDTDPKTALQELMQSKGMGAPYYQTVERKEPDHAVRFKVRVTLGEEILAEAWGVSVKEAEFAAAQKALKNQK